MHADEVALEQLQVRGFARRLESLAGPVAVAIDETMAAVNQPAFRHASKTRQARFDGARAESVIGVQKDDVGRIERLQAGIPCGRQSAIVLANEADTVKLRHDLPGIVGRPIVHHDDCVRKAGLRGDALERFSQEVGMVVGRDDDADRWVGGCAEWFCSG